MKDSDTKTDEIHSVCSSKYVINNKNRPNKVIRITKVSYRYNNVYSFKISKNTEFL